MLPVPTTPSGKEASTAGPDGSEPGKANKLLIAGAQFSRTTVPHHDEREDGQHAARRRGHYVLPERSLTCGSTGTAQRD